MNIRDMYREKYEKHIYAITKDSHEIVSSDKTFDCNLHDIFSLKTDIFIDKYFRCINGFIGHDYLLLQSTVFDVLYYHLLSNEELNSNLAKTRKAELGIAFSLFINVIYSIKEKYLYFIGCEVDDKKLLFKKSILTKEGRSLINDIFAKSYAIIGKYCEARNNLVHNTYDINVDDNDVVIFKLSPFNFRSELEFDKSVKFEFTISEEDISKVLDALYLLRFEYISVISDDKNIESPIMEQKYKNGNVFKIGI